jgi:hypothetical protein
MSVPEVEQARINLHHLSYASHSTVKALCNGQFLRGLCELIVDPCTVWNALMRAFQNGQLTGPATHAFAWLLVELLTFGIMPAQRVAKQNTFKAQLVLKIIRYLGQQGYGTSKLVVPTPYLGQLHLLRELLSKETNPVLNDLDSYDLVRAGLVSHASAQHTKRPIRLSTIGKSCSGSLPHNSDFQLLAHNAKTIIKARKAMLLLPNSLGATKTVRLASCWRRNA